MANRQGQIILCQIGAYRDVQYETRCLQIDTCQLLKTETIHRTHHKLRVGARKVPAQYVRDVGHIIHHPFAERYSVINLISAPDAVQKRYTSGHGLHRRWSA